MPQRISRTSGEAWGPVAAVVGVLVAVLPIVYLGPGGIGVGPTRFAVLVMQVVMGVVGLGVVGAGVSSYRTGDPRLAVAAVTILVGLAVVGGVGAYVEMTGGPLVPIPVWVSAGLLAIGVAIGVTSLLTKE